MNLRAAVASRTGKLRWNHFAGAARLACVCVATARAFAADDNTVIFPAGSPRAATAAASAGGGTLHTLTLVLAIALAAVGAWFVWRNRRGGMTSRDLRALAIEETRSLGNRQYLVVASYEGKKFLLGVCPGRIDMLSDLRSRGGESEATE